MNSLFVLTWRGSFRSNFKRRAIYFDREGDYGGYDVAEGRLKTLDLGIIPETVHTGSNACQGDNFPRDNLGCLVRRDVRL